MTDNQAVPLPGPATWYGPAGQPCECPNLAGDCDGTHVTDDQAVPLPADAITAAVRRAIGDPGSVLPRKAPDYDTYESLTEWQTRAVFAAAAPAIAAQAAAAEREACAQLAEQRRDELADHAQQAPSLPRMSAMLAAKAAAMNEFADLIRVRTGDTGD